MPGTSMQRGKGHGEINARQRRATQTEKEYKGRQKRRREIMGSTSQAASADGEAANCSRWGQAGDTDKNSHNTFSDRSVLAGGTTHLSPHRTPGPIYYKRAEAPSSTPDPPPRRRTLGVELSAVFVEALEADTVPQ